MSQIYESIPNPKSKEKNLFLSDEVNQETIGKLAKEIIEINEYDDYLIKLFEIHDLVYVRKPIKLFIDSYGGAVYQCFGLLSLIESSKTPIHTYITGTAMSCGFMIAICGHKRFCYKLSTPLYHQVSSVAIGTLRAIEEDVVEARRLQKKIEEIVLMKTKITKKKLEKIYIRKKDWYMTPEEALSLGVVDEIL